LSIGADVLFRRAGYDWSAQVHEQDDGAAGDLILGLTEQTRAEFWDFPILARYYMKPRSEQGARTFFTGGLALRAVSGLSTIHEVTDDELVRDTDTTPVGPENSLLQGAIVGAGVQLRDDVGLKVELEVRLTRWFQHSLRSGPANSRQNQAEFVFGLVF
jgi:hypothetical protein